MADKNNSKKQTETRVKSMPNSEIVEKSLLSVIMKDTEVAPDIFARVKDLDFYSPRHQELYRNLLHRYREGQPYDPVGVISGMTEESLSKCGGEIYIFEVAGFEYSSATFEDDIVTLKDLSNARKILKITDIIQNRVYNNEKADDIIAYTQDEFFNLKSANETRELKIVRDSSPDVMAGIYDAFTNNNQPRALSTGFSILDSYANGGFYPSQMLVLAARPGKGKTAFAMNIVENIARNDPDKVIAVFSLEMAREELIMRMYANESQVDNKIIKDASKMQTHQLELIQKAQKVFDNANIYIDDSSKITMNEIALKVRRLKSKVDRIDLVVIDHMQLITDTASRSRSRYEQMTDISRAVKVLAKEVEVPVLVLSQMSRLYEQDETSQPIGGDKPKQRLPKMSDLRESGAIEQDADMIMFITEGDFVSSDGTEPIGVYIAKNRSGDSEKMCYYEWNKGTMTFQEKMFVQPTGAAKQQNNNAGANQNVPPQNDQVEDDGYVPEEPQDQYDTAYDDIDMNPSYLDALREAANGETDDM